MANLIAGILTIAGDGAVPTLAIARTNHAMKTSQIWLDPFALCVQPVLCQRFRGPRRLVFVAGVEWFSRLCVLMNPGPAGLEIHPDLAGYRAFPLGKTL